MSDELETSPPNRLKINEPVLEKMERAINEPVLEKMERAASLSNIYGHVLSSSCLSNFLSTFCSGANPPKQWATCTEEQL